jgi:hypothetical protein
LLARVRSLLRIKAFHDQVQAQARELADWNRILERRVAEGVRQIELMGRLKRSPLAADRRPDPQRCTGQQRRRSYEEPPARDHRGVRAGRINPAFWKLLKLSFDSRLIYY